MEAMALLSQLEWPGNIRQLENAVYRAVVMSDSDQLGLADFPQAAAQSQAPFAEKVKPARTAEARGSVLQQVLPDVSRSAQNTITGRVKVNVRVAVDASGNVSQATVTPVVQSKYFAKQALAAARRWKFNPPQVNGQATSSEWLLRFQFGRMSTQVFPSEINP